MKVYMLNPPYFPHFGRGMWWQDTGRGRTLYYPIWLSYAAGGEGHQKAIISYPNLSLEKITRAVDELLKGYYLSIRYVLIALRQVLRRHGLEEMRRFWYSTRMFFRYIGERG